MYVGVTGTSSENEAVMERNTIRIRKAFALLDPTKHKIVTGACIGVDALAARIAKELGFKVLTIVPANRSKVDPQWRDFCDESIEMQAGTDYRARNDLLVHHSELLLAFPSGWWLNPRSGESMTVNIAKRRGVPVQICAEE